MTVSPASLPDAVERVAASVVGIASRRRGIAAGVVWSAGRVVTTASALGHASRVHVVRPDGETVIGEVRGTDDSTDLAVVAVATDGLPAIDREEPAAPRVGTFVFAVGRDASGAVHASFGHLGAVAGAWRTWRGGEVDRLLRLDGGLYPELAGAPVADDAGRVIGVGSPTLSRHHGVVLPSTTIDRVTDALAAHGRIARGYLGVAVQTVEAGAAMRAAAGAGLTGGLLVTGLGEDGPAARAGLMIGDVLLEADERAVPDLQSLRAALAGDRVGTRVPLRILRGGQVMTVGVDVTERRPMSRC